MGIVGAMEEAESREVRVRWRSEATGSWKLKLSVVNGIG